MALAATDVVWGLYDGVAIPSGPAGPHDSSQGRAREFDHSPQGAVLAAINIAYRAQSDAGPAVFTSTIREQVVGPDQGTLLTKEQSNYNTTGPQSAEQVATVRAQHLQVWAYRLDAYSDGSASVNMVTRQVLSSGPTFANFGLRVQWQNGDWRLVAPLLGDWKNALTPLVAVPATDVPLGVAP